MGEMDLKKAEYYTNRELSWLGLSQHPIWMNSL